MDAHRKWTLWLGATVTSFVVLEGLALREPLTEAKPSGTLTAYLRFSLGIQPRTRRRFWAGALFAGFWGWLVGHVLAGWPPNDLPRRREVPPCCKATSPSTK